ncbi:MAG TPA: glucose-1-phosphate cytidylyltransferase [Stellaceae bacterium]|nr:glucose-1-phosphate cytidylyltransferase [Stellaceae bacterium]
MQAVILCGGLGTRLREETEFRPKPMIQIGHRPILWHIMKLYSHHGVHDFILAAGYKSEIIKQYFLHYEVMDNDVTIELGRNKTIEIHHPSVEEQSWRVTIADTGETALKGARLKRVARHITSDAFLVTYGDGVADVDVTKLMAFHRAHGRIATVTGIRPVSRFGELNVQGDRVAAFFEKPASVDDFANGGFFVFQREILDYLRDEDDCDLEIGVLEKLASAGELMVYRHNGFWACMDTQRDVDQLRRLWSSGTAPWKVW